MHRKPLVCRTKSGVIIQVHSGLSEPRKAMKKFFVALFLLASTGVAAQDLPPEGAVWQYSVTAVGLSGSAYSCIINRLPANPATNQAGFAPNEGDFYTNPAWPVPTPSGLALAILECAVPPWTDPAARWCFAPPSPWYTGFYPHQRIAQFLTYFCAHPFPVVYESYVVMRREAYFPPPVMANGFE